MKPYGYVAIKRSCLRCGRPLPVNGPVEFVRCASCFTVNPVPLLVFPQAFKIARSCEERLVAGATRTQTPMTDGGIYELTWGIHPPACRSCSAPLPELPASTGELHCPGCGVACRTSEPPAWMKELCPGVEQIYLGAPEHEASAQPPGLPGAHAGARPVAMPCASCGGGLSITAETPREHQCPFCKRAVEIPVEIWDRLHPVEEVRGWFVRFGDGSLEVSLPTLTTFAGRFAKHRRLLERADGPMNRNLPGPSRFACLELGCACPRCKNTIPINGPLARVTCPTCETARDLAPEGIGDMLAWLSEPEPSRGGQVIHQSLFTVKQSRVPPYCRRCEAELPLVAPGTDGTITCPKCSAPYDTFPVPARLRPHAGDALQVYCAQRESAPGLAAETGAVDFACPSCGATIAIDGETGRIHACKFCNNDLFVPDELWHRFHPVTKILPWFVDAGKVPVSAEVARRAEAAALAKQAAAAATWEQVKFWAMFLFPALVALVVAFLVWRR